MEKKFVHFVEHYCFIVLKGSESEKIFELMVENAIKQIYIILLIKLDYTLLFGDKKHWLFYWIVLHWQLLQIYLFKIKNKVVKGHKLDQF